MSGVKCSNTNFPSEISVPFETNSCLAHVILYLLETDIVNTCCRWVLGSPHTALEVTSGTVGGCSDQELKTHLQSALAQTKDTICMLAQFLKTVLSWKNALIRFEDPPVCFP